MRSVLLRFPEEQCRRGPLRSLAIPCLLVVADGTPPPTCPDPLEDWIWRSASAEDRAQRVATLDRRAKRRREPPSVDEDGVLHFHGRTTSLSATEAVLAARFAAHLDELVERDTASRAVWPDGGSRPRTLDMHILQLRRRVAEVGLEVQTIRSRGWLMRDPDRARARQSVVT